MGCTEMRGFSPPPLSLPTLSLSEWLEEKRRRRRGKSTIAYRSKVRVSEGHLVRFGGRGRGWIRSLRTHMRTWMNRLLSSCSAIPCPNKRLINLFLLWTKNVKGTKFWCKCVFGYSNLLSWQDFGMHARNSGCGRKKPVPYYF